MKTLILLAASALILSACTQPVEATKTLASNGFTNISIGGYAWFGCSKDDFYHTEFSALSINGSRVSGAVCSGLLFKNSTIRFE